MQYSEGSKNIFWLQTEPFISAGTVYPNISRIHHVFDFFLGTIEEIQKNQKRKGFSRKKAVMQNKL